MSVPADFKKEDYNSGSIGSDDELLLIRVPKAFDVSKLDGKRFSKHHVTEIGRDDGPADLSTVYRCTFYKNDGIGVQPLIRSQQNVILGESLQGLVSVTKSFELGSPLANHRVQGPSPVPMPPGLKTRFTPFGAGDPIKRKLDSDDLGDCLNSVSKKKKKKKSRKELEDFESPMKSEHCIEHNNRKHELEEKMNHTQDSDMDVTEDVKRSKKKKKKSMSSCGSVQSNLLNEFSKSDLSVSHSDLNAEIKMEKDIEDNNSKSYSLDLNGSLSDQVGSSIKKKKKKKDKRKIS